MNLLSKSHACLLSCIIFTWITTVDAYIPRNCTLLEHPRGHSRIPCGQPVDPLSLIQTSKLGASRIGEAFKTETYDYCRDVALVTQGAHTTYPYSVGFSYDTSNSLCALYDGNYFSPQPSNDSTTYFYDGTCWACHKPSCPLPFNEDIVVNGGFELLNEYSPPWNLYGGQVRGGYKSQHAKPNPRTSYANPLPPIIPLCDQALYKLVFYYKLDKPANSSGGVLYDIQFFDDIFLNITDTQNEWTRFEGLLKYFRLPRAKSRIIFPYLYLFFNFEYLNDTTLLFDDIQIYTIDQASANTPEPGAESILSNGGFESGLVDPWQISPYDQYGEGSNFTITNDGINSTHALKVYVNGKKQARFNSGGFTVVQRNIPTKYLAQYVVSFDYTWNKTVKGSSGDLSFRLNSFLEGREVLFDKFHQKLIRPGTFRFSEAFIANGQSLDIVFDILLVYSGAEVLLDNIEMLEVATGGAG